jgi:hypothetical protein
MAFVPFVALGLFFLVGFVARLGMELAVLPADPGVRHPHLRSRFGQPTTAILTRSAPPAIAALGHRSGPPLWATALGHRSLPPLWRRSPAAGPGRPKL